MCITHDCRGASRPSRMANVCPAEFYFRHVIARYLRDTSYRLKEITQPTLVLVGNNEDEVTAGVHPIESAQVLVNRTPADRLVMLTREGPSYFFAKRPTRPSGTFCRGNWLTGKILSIVLWKIYIVQDLPPRKLRLRTCG